MTEAVPSFYPGIRQSFAILGTLILSAIIFAPLFLLENAGVKKEIVFLIYYILVNSLPAWYYYRRRQITAGLTGFKFGVGNYRILLLVILATFVMGLGIINPIVELIPMSEMMREIFLDIGDPKHIAFILAVVIAAPVLEEIIFRGIILDGLLKKYSPVKAIVVSSVLFGLIHLNPWQFVSAFMGGLFIGWVYYRTQSLGLAIIIHAANNLFFTIAAWMTNEDNVLESNISSVEFYGGWLNYAFIIVGCIVIFAGCLWGLKKQFDKPDLIGLL